jgi:hypothetical protein
VIEDIERAAKELGNADAGWVNRRDAAGKLGQIASEALGALKAHADEMDVDVHRVVEEALEKASGALAGVKPSAPVKHYALEELVKACAKDKERVVAPHGKGFVVQVELKGGRRQSVFLSQHSRKDGMKLIRVYTECGKASKDALAWALRANMNVAQGALALSKEAGEERLVLINCFLVDQATPLEVKASVKELAAYGDWIEEKLSGLDEF